MLLLSAYLILPFSKVRSLSDMESDKCLFGFKNTERDLRPLNVVDQFIVLVFELCDQCSIFHPMNAV